MDRRSLRIAASLSLLTWIVPAALGAAERDRVLEWIPPAGIVDGYRVHVGAASSSYDDVLDLGSVPKDPDGICRSTLTLAAERDYYIAVSAYNAAGESGLSNEIRVEASACDPAACDDGNVCNGFESCGDDGSCSAGVPLSCGEPSACASPTCDPVLGCVSIAVLNGTECDDGNSLTSGDQCRQGFCVGRRGKSGKGGGGRSNKSLGGR